MLLRDWRVENELTQDQLALKLDLTQPTISKIERHEVWPNRETMERIFKLTNGKVSANDFTRAA